MATAKFRINGKDYTWSALMRMTKDQLLAEAQKMGSARDSHTTMTKEDLVDYLVWLSDRRSSAIFDYWQNYTGGWVRVTKSGEVEVEDFSEVITYNSRQEAADDLLFTIREWAKDSEDARKFLDSIGDDASSARSRVGVPEAFYTGGGIYISAMYVDENIYYAIDNDWYDDCFAIYDHRGEDDDVEFPCQNMVDSKNVADATEEEKRIYAILKAALDKEMA